MRKQPSGKKSQLFGSAKLNAHLRSVIMQSKTNQAGFVTFLAGVKNRDRGLVLQGMERGNMSV